METMLNLVTKLRNSLTVDNWFKGGFFNSKDNNICMCVHGAAQKLVNPQVGIALNSRNQSTKVIAQFATQKATVVMTGGAAGSAGRDAAKSKQGEDIDMFALWNNIPSKYSTDRIYNEINFGNIKLHYLLGLFGITSAFNDSPDTTIEMLYAKLDEVIEFCRINSI